MCLDKIKYFLVHLHLSARDFVLRLPFSAITEQAELALIQPSTGLGCYSAHLNGVKGEIGGYVVCYGTGEFALFRIFPYHFPDLFR